VGALQIWRRNGHVQVVAQLVLFPEGKALTEMFEEFCHGVDKVMEFARHVDMDSPVARASRQRNPKESMKTSEPVFLIVRNNCEGSVAITIEHEVDLLFALPLSTVSRLLQVKSDH
jgi:hypothetical protein